MNRTEAHDRLVKAINDRTGDARQTVERVLNVVPQDSIVKAAGLRFLPLRKETRRAAEELLSRQEHSGF